MTIFRPFFRFHALIGACALTLFCHAQAQSSSNPVRIVVGYAPGGGADTAARIVADKLATVLEQPVIVENRPGAGGQIAAQYVKAASADGSVLLMSNNHTLFMVPLTVRNPGFNASHDFQPVGSVATFELALATNVATTRAKTMPHFVQWLTANRDSAAIGVPAAASPPEFMAQRITQTYKVSGVPIPYKGAGPMVPDLLGSTLQAAVSGVSDFLQYHRSGRLQILAVTRRTPLLPDVPSFAEVGLPGLELTEMLGLYAPVGVPTPVISRYNVALNKVLAMPEVVAKFKGQDMSVLPGTPSEQGKRAEQIDHLMTDLVRSSGFVKP